MNFFLKCISWIYSSETRRNDASVTFDVKEDSQAVINRTVALMLLVSGIFLLVSFFGEYGVFAKYRLQARRVLLEQEVDSLKQQILNLHAETEALRTNPQVIEAMARRELGMARADEVIYIFRSEIE